MKSDDINWEKVKGLIPAVVQDSSSGQVLMLGYMNEQALQKTLESGWVTFWSRSRSRLWVKGETSGNRLRFVEARRDCDGDALLVLAKPSGPTCHRGTRSCFAGDLDFSGLEILAHLERVVQARKENPPQRSYTAALFRKGLSEIAKKCGEEAVEVVVSAWQDRCRTVEESADLLFHLMVLLAEREIPLAEVMGELQQRHAGQ